MRWRVERATLRDGWSTFLVINDTTFEPHPEAMGFTVAMGSTEKSPNTIRAYAHGVAVFLTWAQIEAVDWTSVTMLDLTRFKRHLQVTPSARTGRVRASGTVSLTLTAVAEFLRHCAANGRIEQAVANRLIEPRHTQTRSVASRGEGHQFQRGRTRALRVKVTENAPEVLSDDQVAAMRDNAHTYRDRFLLRVLHDGGPRIGEVLGLQSEDVHLLPNSRALGCAIPGPHLHIRRRTTNENRALSKARMPRHIPVAAPLIEDYRAYQSERYKLLGNNQSPFLFVSYRGTAQGKPMNYSNAYQLIRRLGQAAGFRATPHMFRHSAATAWVAAGSDIDVVQTLLGHVSPDSTHIYLHASDERLREAVVNVHHAQGQGDTCL